MASRLVASLCNGNFNTNRDVELEENSLNITTTENVHIKKDSRNKRITAGKDITVGGYASGVLTAKGNIKVGHAEHAILKGKNIEIGSEKTPSFEPTLSKEELRRDTEAIAEETLLVNGTVGYNTKAQGKTVNISGNVDKHAFVHGKEGVNILGDVSEFATIATKQGLDSIKIYGKIGADTGIVFKDEQGQLKHRWILNDTNGKDLTKMKPLTYIDIDIEEIPHFMNGEEQAKAQELKSHPNRVKFISVSSEWLRCDDRHLQNGR